MSSDIEALNHDSSSPNIVLDKQTAIPRHIVSMTLAMTPQQLFEGADRMLTQAASVRECAGKLQVQVQFFHNEADALEEEAFDLQKQAMDNREEIDGMFQRVLEQYKQVLPRYRTKKPQTLAKVLLAVEEGRAMREQVETFAEQLRIFAETLNDESHSAVESNKEEINQIAKSSPTNKVSSPSAPAMTKPDFKAHQVTEIADNTQGADDPQATVDLTFSDDNSQSASPSSKTHDHDEDSKATDRKRKLSITKDAHHLISKDEKSAVPERKKRKHAYNESRKQEVINNLECEKAEIPDVDATMNTAPPSEKINGGGRKNRKKNKNKKTAHV